MKKVVMLVFLTTILFSCSKKDSEVVCHRWQKLDIDFYLNKEANALTEIVVRETFQKWAEKTHFAFHYRGRNRAGLRKDGKNTVSFLIRWPEEVPINKVAYCKKWYDRKGNIVEADIIFNMQITRFTTLRTGAPDSYYIEGVLAHEIGHFIGLEHIDSDKSIMKPASDAEESYLKGAIDEITLSAYRELYQINDKPGMLQ